MGTNRHWTGGRGGGVLKGIWRSEKKTGVDREMNWCGRNGQWNEELGREMRWEDPWEEEEGV